MQQCCVLNFDNMRNALMSRHLKRDRKQNPTFQERGWIPILLDCGRLCHFFSKNNIIENNPFSIGETHRRRAGIYPDI